MIVVPGASLHLELKPELAEDGIARVSIDNQESQGQNPIRPLGPLESFPIPWVFTQFPIGTSPSHGECRSIPMRRAFPIGHITVPMGSLNSFLSEVSIISHGNASVP